MITRKRAREDEDYHPPSKKIKNYDEEKTSDSEDSLYSDCQSEKYNHIKKYIKDTTPTFSILEELQTNSIQEQAEIYELLDIYRDISVCPTLETISLKKNIQMMIEDAKNAKKFREKYSPQELQRIEDIIVCLEKNILNENIKYTIASLNASLCNKQVIYSEYKRYLYLKSSDDDEQSKLYIWLKRAISLPYKNICTISSENTGKLLRCVMDKLNSELYGMQKVKEQILIFLHTKLTNPNMGRCSLGLVGSPGTGKTEIAHIIAKLLDFPFCKIPLGGVTDPSELNGHGYTYISAKPGKIVEGLIKMQASNGIMFFDEYDKVSGNKNIENALLHITDPIQNSNFSDQYFHDISIDLSRLWFFYAMNEIPENDALADRVYYVHIPKYTREDKIIIVCDFVLVKALKKLGMNKDDIIFDEDAISFILCIDNSKGIRQLEHIVDSVVRKIDFLYHHKNIDVSFNIGKNIVYPIVITKKILEKLL